MTTFTDLILQLFCSKYPSESSALNGMIRDCLETNGPQPVTMPDGARRAVMFSGSPPGWKVVDRAIAAITVSPDAPLVAVGASTQCRAFANFNDGTSEDVTNQVTWMDSDHTQHRLLEVKYEPISMGTMDDTGLFTATNPGDVVIGATLVTVDNPSGFSGKTSLTVEYPRPVYHHQQPVSHR